MLSIESKLNLKHKNHFNSIEKRELEIEKHKLILQSKGYIATYVISKIQKDSLLKVKFYIGEKYKWNIISKNEIINQIIPENKFPKTLNSITTPILMNRILSYCENNGYPFATIKFDKINIIEKKINANINLHLNDYFYIDSIEIKGETKTSRNFILKSIGIKKGNTYNEKEIREISAQINAVPFLENIKSPEVYFTNSKATIVVYIKDKKTSVFDGILGLNSNTITNKYELIGELKLDLQNIFKTGEQIIFNWEKVKQNSQNYFVSIKQPYLFRTKIGTIGQLNYYRQDTSFANLNTKIGLTYQINSKSKFTLFAQNLQSNSIHNILDNTIFPSFNSLHITYYGVSFLYANLDYVFNPRKGLRLNAEILTGIKTIKKESSNLDFAYNQLEEKINQQKLALNISYFLPLFNQTTVLIRLNSETTISNQLFENELSQIGGLLTIRGFNEQAIIANTFHILTAEYRYLFSKNSAIFTFLDYAYYENKSNNTFIHDTPLGFGLGVNFATNSGIFTLNYSLGKEQNNPILIKNGKIHFGFISLF